MGSALRAKRKQSYLDFAARSDEASCLQDEHQAGELARAIALVSHPLHADEHRYVHRNGGHRDPGPDQRADLQERMPPRLDADPAVTEVHDRSLKGHFLVRRPRPADLSDIGDRVRVGMAWRPSFFLNWLS